MANVRNKSAVTSDQSRPPQVLSSDTLTCPLCSAILTSRSHLLRHVGTEHRDSFFAICKTCMQCFAPKEIDNHVTTCKGSFICPYCRQTFALLPYLNRHIRRKHSIDDENRAPSNGGGLRYACKFCSKTYSSNSSLNSHIRKHFNCVCNLCGSRVISESKKTFGTCEACGNQISFNSGLEGEGDTEMDEDERREEGEVKKHGRTISNTTVATTAETIRIPQFTCPHCQRLYVSLTCFRKHLAAHAPSQPPTSVVSPNSITKTTPNTGCSAGSTADFCDLFTEEDWMQADSYLCLSATPNISLLHSILYEGASTEFL